MSLQRPTTSRILTSILIALERRIQPEMQTDQGRFTVSMAAYLLRALIIREQDGEAILRDAIPVARDQLRQAERFLGWPEHAAAKLPDGADVKELADHRVQLAGMLEAAAAQLVAAGEGGRALLRSLIDGEVALLDRIDPPAFKAGEQYSGADPSDGIDLEMMNDYLARAQPFGGSKVCASGIVRLLGGFSKDTFIVSLEGPGRPCEKAVLRRDSPSGPIETSVTEEFPAMRGVFRAGFPVAEPFFVEPDPGRFRSPFMMSRFQPGQPIMRSDGTTLNFTVEKATQGAIVFAGILARMHALDPRALGYPDAVMRRTGREHVGALVDEFEAYWAARKPEPEPIMAAAFAWLRSNIPDMIERPSIVHGDASLRNAMLHEGEITALLDWETVHIGDPAEDLAYLRIDIERFMPWQVFLDAYYKAGGREYRAQNARFFRLWADVRNSAYSLPHGFETAATPDMRFAWSSSLYHRIFLRRIARFLQDAAPA